MDTKQIPAKTDKGRAEIDTRANKLDFRRRQLLILVDGKTSVVDLIEKATHLGDVAQRLNMLAQEGFIMLPAGRLAESAAAPAAPTPVAAATVVLENGPVDHERFIAAKRMASRLMYDAMGPDSEMFTVKLEATNNRGDFMVQLGKCREVLKQLRGSSKSEQFWQTIVTTLG